MSFNANFNNNNKLKKKKLTLGHFCNKLPNYVQILLVIAQFVGNNCVKHAATEIII